MHHRDDGQSPVFVNVVAMNVADAASAFVPSLLLIKGNQNSSVASARSNAATIREPSLVQQHADPERRSPHRGQVPDEVWRLFRGTGVS